MLEYTLEGWFFMQKLFDISGRYYIDDDIHVNEWKGAIILNEDGWFAFRPRPTYPQLKMSDIINEYNENNEEKATILTYDTLDYGLYYNTNTLPSTKYFCGLNIPLKEIGEEQNRLVENGLVTFVGTMNETLPEEYLDQYELVYTDSSWFEFAMHTYYLYQLKV